MSALLLVVLLGAAGWATASAARAGSLRRPGREADPSWKARHDRNKTPGGRAFPNRLVGRGRPGARLLPAPFRPGDLVWVDGEWYHLPTLLRLHRDGRLAWGSPGWRALEQAGRRRREGLN